MADTKIGHIRPQTVDNLIAHLQTDTELADATIRRVLAPLKACLADAARRGDIAANPAAGCRVRARPRIVENEEERARTLSRQQLADLIAATDPRWRLLVEFLASTGLRISEALALRWRDLDLGNAPRVRVVLPVKQARRSRSASRSRATPGAPCRCRSRWRWLCGYGGRRASGTATTTSCSRAAAGRS